MRGDLWEKSRSAFQQEMIRFASLQILKYFSFQIKGWEEITIEIRPMPASATPFSPMIYPYNGGLSPPFEKIASSDTFVFFLGAYERNCRPALWLQSAPPQGHWDWAQRTEVRAVATSPTTWAAQRSHFLAPLLHELLLATTGKRRHPLEVDEHRLAALPPRERAMQTAIVLDILRALPRHERGWNAGARREMERVAELHFAVL
eukprot:gnl/Chilomastix_cuspidata/1277.p1 GENE.gnl/Chilomastix_cuspidata/1277~~gnl/Chilomastix_cuspidata/1277.p1  ORF type:complete len:204 (+),score=63.90 gnl/Chilomastix_cuspidata/1277:102-713(+)